MSEENNKTEEPAKEEPAKDDKTGGITYTYDAGGGKGDSEKKEEPKKDENKPKDSDKEIKLELPKETNLSNSDKERIADYAKKQGLSQEAAQDLLNKENLARNEFVETLAKERENQASEWVDEVKNDKEIGGDNYESSVKYAQRAAAKFGTKDFLNVLNESGYGNHPEVVRTLARIGKAMSDDKIVFGEGDSQGKKKSLADMLYGNSE